jgi:hypothetical protein
MYAYEAAGGVQFLLELLASDDVDPLYDARRKLTLISNCLDGGGLLGLLKKADRSFEPVRKRGFRAANAGQLMVDLIVAPRPMRESEPITFRNSTPSPSMKTASLCQCARPRAFALHKAWLSQQPERNPVRKPRDLAQAKTVARLVREAMPHLSFDEALTSLHGDVRAMRKLLGV